MGIFCVKRFIFWVLFFRRVCKYGELGYFLSMGRLRVTIESGLIRSRELVEGLGIKFSLKG